MRGAYATASKIVDTVREIYPTRILCQKRIARVSNLSRSSTTGLTFVLWQGTLLYVVHLLCHLRRGLTSTFPVVFPGNCDPIPGKRSVWESGAPRGILISSEARSWTTRSPLHLSERHKISSFCVHVCIAELYTKNRFSDVTGAGDETWRRKSPYYST